MNHIQPKKGIPCESEFCAVGITAVNASTKAGATLTSFTGNVLIAEQSEMAIYSQNGGTLPLFVSITAGGTATFEANSLAGPKDEDGDLPPDPAKIVTTNFPVFQASETETAFLPIPQWVDNGVFLPMVTGLGFDWFEKQMIAILGPIVAEGGDLDEVMRQIFQIEVVGLPVDVLGRVDLDHRSTSTVLIDPFFNSARINAIPGLIICGKVIGNHLTNVLIHEGRHTFQNFITTLDLDQQDDIPFSPDNDDDRDFLVDSEDVPASASLSGIILDTTASRTVCNQRTNELPTRSYKGDGSQQGDDISDVLLAIEYDAHVFAEAHD